MVTCRSRLQHAEICRMFAVDVLNNQSDGASVRSVRVRQFAMIRAIRSLAFCIVGVVSCVRTVSDSSPEGAPVVLNELVELRGVADSVDLVAQSPVISLSGYVAAQTSRSRGGGVAVFNTRGELVKSIGRFGHGPGEFGGITSIGFGAGDTLWLVDQYFTLHAFTPPPSLEYVRTVVSEHPLSGAITRFGILSNAVLWQQRVAPPTLYDWRGQQRATFGQLQPQATANRLIGAVAVKDSSTIWAASGDAYDVQQLNRKGEILQRIARRVDWFPSGVVPSGVPWEHRPSPRLIAISEDRDGILWVVAQRAALEWRPESAGVTPADVPIPISRIRSRADVSQYYQTVLDAFDSRNGKLLASEVLEGDVIGFAAPGVLCRLAEALDGTVQLRLYSLAIGGQ